MTPRIRSIPAAAATAALATGGLAIAGTAAGAGPAPVPCHGIGGGKYNCEFYPAGDGHSGGAPVQAGGSTVGFLHKGTNYVLCQQTGGRITNGRFFNSHWAWTVADNGKTGWVNAVWAKGGDNDGPFATVRGCGNAHGAPPAGPSQNPPKPAPAPPPSGGSFRPDVSSAPDKAHYDDAGPWAGGKNCSHGFTPGAKRLQAWLQANFGAAKIQGYNCRPNSANKSRTSIHGVGRASDWFRDANNAQQSATVAKFIARMSANGAAQARAMGVQYWIWNRHEYSVRGTRVVKDSYGGPVPHTDHVHIEQNIAGSKLQTSYWR